MLTTKPVHLDNLYSNATTLDPMADEDQPGYMPTVAVVRIVRDHFNAFYIRCVAKRYVRRITKRHGYRQFTEAQCPDALINGMALEIACREILDANPSWLERS